MNDKITNLEVIRTNGGKVNLAFGYMTVCGFIKIRFNVMTSKKGSVFVAWPQQQYEQNGEKKYTDHVSFISEDDRKEINSKIINEYNKIIGNVNIERESNSSNDDDTTFPHGENVSSSQEESEPGNKPKKIPLLKMKR